jgi:hypothetical protein
VACYRSTTKFVARQIDLHAVFKIAPVIGSLTFFAKMDQRFFATYDTPVGIPAGNETPIGCKMAAPFV